MDLSAQEPNEGIDISAALSALRRWLWLIGLIMIAVIAASRLYLTSRTPLYTAWAEVLLEEMESPIDLGGVLGMGQLTNSVVETEIEVLSSQTVMDMIVRRMNLVDDPEFNPPPAEDGAVRGALQGLG